MKAAVARKPLIRVAVVESDPLRFVGFRALFDTNLIWSWSPPRSPTSASCEGIDLVFWATVAARIYTTSWPA